MRTTRPHPIELSIQNHQKNSTPLERRRLDTDHRGGITLEQICRALEVLNVGEVRVMKTPALTFVGITITGLPGMTRLARQGWDIPCMLCQLLEGPGPLQTGQELLRAWWGHMVQYFWQCRTHERGEIWDHHLYIQ